MFNLNHEVSKCSTFPVLKGLWDHEEVESMLWIVMKQRKKQQNEVPFTSVRYSNSCFFVICCCLFPLQRSFDVSVVRFQFVWLSNQACPSVVYCLPVVRLLSSVCLMPLVHAHTWQQMLLCSSAAMTWPNSMSHIMQIYITKVIIYLECSRLYYHSRWLVTME